MPTQQVAPLATFSERDGSIEIVEVLGDDDASRRLVELGFGVGKRLSIVKRGDPAIVSIGGTRFALSDEFQSRIFARLVSA